MPDWDGVYTEKSVEAATPADVLLLNEHLLSAGGQALDYASGLAGNGIYLAKKGYDVSAWDLSTVAAKKINQYAQNSTLSLQADVFNLENNAPPIKATFDLIVVSYFLHRESLRDLYDRLNKGGLLFYQTFSGQPFNGQGPLRAAFRLKENELLTVFSDMQILYYREDSGHSDSPDARPGLTYLVARK